MTVVSSEVGREGGPVATQTISSRSKWIARGILILVTLGLLEVVSCIGGRVLRKRGTFYEPGGAEGFKDYFAIRDPELGWPPLVSRGDRDASGARNSPAFPDASIAPCISLYGDSFTYGDEVDDEHAWGNLLARKAGCRVANFGARGYGTDQAFMLFRRKKDDRPKVILLGLPAENIHRNVNMYRGLIVAQAPFTFKPRFLVGDDGNLQTVPIASPTTEEEYLHIVRNPKEHLKHEFFAPGGASGTTELTFPYTLSILSLINNFRIRAAIKKEPSHAAFFSPEHPSKALLVTATIAKTFAKESGERGSWGGFFIIPLIGDMEYRRAKGKLVHQPLIDELNKANIPYLDPTDRFLKEIGSENPCVLFTKCLAGHYNERGYKLLSEVVYEWLKEQGKL